MNYCDAKNNCGKHCTDCKHFVSNSAISTWDGNKYLCRRKEKYIFYDDRACNDFIDSRYIG